MNETERICDQLRRSFFGGAWHGPAVMEVLEDVDARLAAAEPSAGVNSIRRIVLHLTATHGLILRRLGGDATPLADQEDWPAVEETSEESWRETLASLRESCEGLLEAMARIDESVLDRPILPEHSSYYVTFHGTVQHNLYHAGQINILKKSALRR